MGTSYHLNVLNIILVIYYEDLLLIYQEHQLIESCRIFFCTVDDGLPVGFYIGSNILLIRVKNGEEVRSVKVG